MTPGLYLDIPEDKYHADAFGDEGARPSCSVSIAKAMVNESPAHAHMRHPKLGGQPMVPNRDMDRGSLIHALLLGKGATLAIVECDDWKKAGNRELRDEHRAAGRLAVTRSLYDASYRAAEELEKKLAAKGYRFTGDSEVTILWRETTRDGVEVECRARMDHVLDEKIFDLKITGDANPKTLTRGHLTRMGYDIQGAAYPRALEYVCPQLRGRTLFTLLFCEPEPPYCVTPLIFAGTLRELGERKWLRGVNRWDECLSSGKWPDYVDGPVVADARPWELEEEDAVA
jgi:hypothetical protein